MYDAFGNETSRTPALNVAAVDCLFGYTGQPFDTTTDLQNNLNRWYEPSTHVWLSQDPLGLGPDANPYRYCGNAPTDGTDPSGAQLLNIGPPASLNSLGFGVIPAGDQITMAGGPIDPSQRASPLQLLYKITGMRIGTWALQKVTSNGTLTITYCKPGELDAILGQTVHQLDVSYNESFSESWWQRDWKQLSGHPDIHAWGPSEAAAFAMKNYNISFNDEDGKLKLMRGKTELGEVCSWKATLHSVFTLQNVVYQTAPVPKSTLEGGANTQSLRSDHTFSVGTSTFYYYKNDVPFGFKRLLYPTCAQEANVSLNSSPHIVRGEALVCTDDWTASWHCGEANSTVAYTSTGYKPVAN